VKHDTIAVKCQSCQYSQSGKANSNIFYSSKDYGLLAKALSFLGYYILSDI